MKYIGKVIKRNPCNIPYEWGFKIEISKTELEIIKLALTISIDEEKEEHWKATQEKTLLKLKQIV